jgi:hypothetical protein
VHRTATVLVALVALEYATLGWNVIGIAVLVVAAIAARSDLTGQWRRYRRRGRLARR